jgi:hypothetical protein
VSAGKTPGCPPKTTDPEETRYVLRPKEAAAALKRYVQSKKNPKLYDAAFVNAGLRFCGKDEERAVFDQLAAMFAPQEAPKRAFEIVRNYSKSASLLESIEEKLKDPKISQAHRVNLLEARGLTIPPKRVPSPAPSPAFSGK